MLYGILFSHLFIACGEKTTDTSSEPSSEASTEPSSEASTEPSSEASTEPSGEDTGTGNLAVDTLAAGDLIITEIQKNPCVLGDDTDGDGNPDCTLEDELGEWVEVYNNFGEEINLKGLIVHDDGSESEMFTVSEDLIIPAQGFVVFGTNGDTATNGGYDADYVYTGGDAGFKLSNGDDEVILSNTQGVIDEVRYDNGDTFPDDKGYSLSLAPNVLDAIDNDTGTNWCNAGSPYGDGDSGSPGEENSCQ
ncbi:MAG: hypothetical protein CL916_08285 [Deltaproteobacteria bacterium]|nr:hypothetical protein [Deltaproteobacteria bacterium]